MDFDTAFLLKLKKGNKKVFEALFLSTYESLCDYSVSITNSKEDAEGAVQDVFASIWQFRSTLDTTVNIKAFLYKSVKNRSLDICRHKDVRQKYQDQIKALYQSAEPGDTNTTVRLIKRVREEVENLPEGAKIVYLLHRRDGLTYNEIAQVLGISVKTVESRMTKALKMLRTNLEKEMDLKLLPLLAIFLP
ncbi:MAG: RNA polymerase sigma-70 factor [Balneolaceae bacterium]|nr:RNA polymerase sigma-70 factor [Balneolaceae bacterium]